MWLQRRREKREDRREERGEKIDRRRKTRSDGEMEKLRRQTHSARQHDTTSRMDVAVDNSRLVTLECREASPVPRAPHVEL